MRHNDRAISYERKALYLQLAKGQREWGVTKAHSSLAAALVWFRLKAVQLPCECRITRMTAETCFQGTGWSCLDSIGISLAH